MNSASKLTGPGESTACTKNESSLSRYGTVAPGALQRGGTRRRRLVCLREVILEQKDTEDHRMDQVQWDSQRILKKHAKDGACSVVICVELCSGCIRTGLKDCAKGSEQVVKDRLCLLYEDTDGHSGSSSERSW